MTRQLTRQATSNSLGLSVTSHHGPYLSSTALTPTLPLTTITILRCCLSLLSFCPYPYPNAFLEPFVLPCSLPHPNPRLTHEFERNEWSTKSPINGRMDSCSNPRMGPSIWPSRPRAKVYTCCFQGNEYHRGTCCIWPSRTRVKAYTCCLQGDQTQSSASL